MPLNASELTYGIEIECAINSGTGIRIGSYHNGTPCTAFPMNEEGRCWKAERDGSLHGFDMSKTPVEFVSPILRGKAGLDNIRATCAQIKAWGGVTNRSCGLHIHVGFPTDSIAKVRRLTLLVGQFEDALYAMTGTPDRRTGNYCRPIKTDRNKNLNWNLLRDKRDVGYAGDLGDRYRILNWTNFTNGTRDAVEFRVFSGSLNPAKIAAWVQVCLTLVQVALEDGPIGGWDARTSLSGFGSSRGEQMTRYLCRRLWFGRAASSKNYGNLGHETFTRKAAERTLRALAIRHDERTGLRSAEDIDG